MQAAATGMQRTFRFTDKHISISVTEDSVLFECEGRHEKKFMIKTADGGIEAEPFTGVVQTPSSAFGSLYLVAWGLLPGTPDMGVTAKKIRFTWRSGSCLVTFTDYRLRQRTVFFFSGPALIRFRGMLAEIKNGLSLLRFFHDEGNGQPVAVEINRKNGYVRISSVTGETLLMPEEVEALKAYVFGSLCGSKNAIPIKINSMLTVLPDGTMRFADRNISRNGDLMRKLYLLLV